MPLCSALQAGWVRKICDFIEPLIRLKLQLVEVAPKKPNVHAASNLWEIDLMKLLQPLSGCKTTKRQKKGVSQSSVPV